MAKIPGVNPIVLKSLKEYKDYINGKELIN